MDTIENISRKNSSGVIAGKEKIKKRLRVLGYIKNIDYRGIFNSIGRSFQFSRKRTTIALAIGIVMFLFFKLFIKADNEQACTYSALFAVILAYPAYFSVEGNAKKAINILFFALMPLVSFYIVEFLNGNAILNDLTPDQIFLNLIWYYMVYIVALIAVRRFTAAVIIAALIFTAIGIINHYVLTFRGTVIFPCDVITLRTALNVSGNFDFTPDKDVLLACSAFVLQVLGTYRCSGNSRIRIKKKLYIPALAVSFIYTIVFFFTPMLPAIGIYAQQWKTQANGFILNFTTALRYSHVSEPTDYSLDAIKDIQTNITSNGSNLSDGFAAFRTEDGTKPVNIIAIMSESFDDFAEFENLSLSEDPAPFFHSLKENTIKGRMYSPVTGGGTANVEYEYLTGNSLSFLPEGTVAYQLYIKDNAPSLVQQMKSQGYETTAFHPYLASGWNRPDVYSSFKFDNQIFSEDLENEEIIRKYISDSFDFKTIFDITDNADSPQFIFNVTMQNHSAYDKPWAGQKYHVTPVDNCAVLSKTTTAEQYFSLIRESDDAIKELIEHYSNVDEPTLIVFFGDHQPPLGQKFYTHLYGKTLDKRTTEEVLMQYTTPFFIWANYDIPEADDIRISSNYLGVLTAEVAGIPLTGYQQFLSELRSELPVFTNIAIIDKDGNVTESDNESALTPYQQELVKEYTYLNYYSLFDRGNEDTDSFYYIE